MASRGALKSGIGENEGFLRHKRLRWAKIAVIVVVVAIVIYAIDNPQPVPSGGTAYGYILGTIGALLILWLTALGIRKRAMTPGAWSLKAWTSAHVYLGLALIVIATLHTGFQFGWNVHTLAYALMLLVIVSGFVGVVLYATLPRLLSDNRGERTETQMVVELRTLDSQLHDAAQSLDGHHAALVRAALADDPFAAGFWQRLAGRFPRGATRDALDVFRRDRIDAEPVIGLLDRRAAMLVRMRRHMRLKAALEGWLYVHVPTTFALIAALTAHIVAVFFYW
ncbi:MAG: hypothetical protein E7773_01440 [Sphingomonas sp.]|uniref:hypothetical protein n=1 Tax=Sphingomonas sp. TaxID=28214 RepID=UPI001220E711|nr:hypothetical protein [Sphingomonas sp.]THD37681.1 MAG: hypothetical protein E7773_01440 [Sphingomonas sp.]